MQLDISVIVLTKNEEQRLKPCLESVYGWAKEIIVVDDESSDRTREIASQYAHKVLIRKMNIEGKHRNWAYEEAACPWVLSLDADERVTPELKNEIQALLAANNNYTAFTIPRKNYLGDHWLKWGGQYPAAQLKLFRKGRFKWEEVDVHPRAFLEGECGHLHNPLLHYTYRDFADFIQKLNRQTTLEAKKWFDIYRLNPKKAAYKMNFIHALYRALDRFIRTYIVKQGWRDGFVGLVVSFFASLYQILSYAKYWEMKNISQMSTDRNHR